MTVRFSTALYKLILLFQILIKMSAFPRTVKKTNRVFLNKNWNRGLTVLLCGSPLYVGLYGRYIFSSIELIRCNL